MNIAVTSKFGIDGSRNHQIRQQSTCNIVNDDDDDSDDKVETTLVHFGVLKAAN